MHSLCRKRDSSISATAPGPPRMTGPSVISLVSTLHRATGRHQLQFSAAPRLPLLHHSQGSYSLAQKYIRSNHSFRVSIETWQKVTLPYRLSALTPWTQRRYEIINIPCDFHAYQYASLRSWPHKAWELQYPQGIASQFLIVSHNHISFVGTPGDQQWKPPQMFIV